VNDAGSEDLVKVHLSLSDATFGIGGESVWAKPLGDDLYEIRNTPWHTCDVSWGDIVRAISENEDQWPEFIEVVRPSGHRTLHIFFFRECTEQDKAEVLASLKRWKANYENGDDKLYAIDVESAGDFDGLCKYLDQYCRGKKIDYRTVVSPAKT
jgi:hypothetical protein